jgi:integrase
LASISTAPGGYRVIQFVAGDGKRRSIRLGKVSKRIAEEIRVRVEALNAAVVAGVSWDTETARWVAGLAPALADKLAAVGLIPKRHAQESTRLGTFLERYIAGRTDAKRRTRLNLKMFADRLIAFFGVHRELTTIKRSDADAWLISLKETYAPATVGRTVKGARQLFKAACRAELITRNPFEDVKAAAPPDKDRQCFVSREDTQRVLDACPDHQWRLIVALSRYGGLRCPSEHLALTWPDVDWERGRFRVTSPKTEHHEGKGERWVPLFPELRPYVTEAFERAEPGTLPVITIKRDTDQNLRTRFMKIIRRAGLSPWPKLFQNLRASRETELAAEYPMHVVCAWIGNSERIAAKHYLQVTEDYFARAAQEGAAQSGAQALQNPVQHAAAGSRTHSQDSTEAVGATNLCETVRLDASPCEIRDYAWRDSNPQPTAP